MLEKRKNGRRSSTVSLEQSLVAIAYRFEMSAKHFLLSNASFSNGLLSRASSPGDVCCAGRTLFVSRDDPECSVRVHDEYPLVVSMLLSPSRRRLLALWSRDSTLTSPIGIRRHVISSFALFDGTARRNLNWCQFLVADRKRLERTVRVAISERAAFSGSV